MPQLLDSTAIPFLTLGLLIVGCIISSKLSSRFSMPCLLLFLHGEAYLVEGIAYSGSVKG